MQINAISAYSTGKPQNDTNPAFKSLVIDKSAKPIIDRFSANDLSEFKKIKRSLSKTKFWDLHVFAAGENPHDFKYNFVSKIDKNNVITDGIYLLDRNNKEIKFYSIIYGPENTSINIIDKLKYNSAKTAQKLYEKYTANRQFLANRNYNITPLESLKLKLFELYMIESAKLTGQKVPVNKIYTAIITKNTVGNELKF